MNQISRFALRYGRYMFSYGMGYQDLMTSRGAVTEMTCSRSNSWFLFKPTICITVFTTKEVLVTTPILLLWIMQLFTAGRINFGIQMNSALINHFYSIRLSIINL